MTRMKSFLRRHGHCCAPRFHILPRKLDQATARQTLSTNSWASRQGRSASGQDGEIPPKLSRSQLISTI